jgi:hypothetical protein
MTADRATTVADRATTAADRACILVAVIISVITVVTVVAITVVVIIEYLSSARPSMTQADRDIPIRFFHCHWFGPPPETPNWFKRSMRVAA